MWLPGGVTGVDVFFVISGFVVSASLQRLPAAGSWGVFAQFYARRMRRLAPALVACLLVTALASGLFIPNSWLSETSAKTGRMACVGLSNWVLAALVRSRAGGDAGDAFLPEHRALLAAGQRCAAVPGAGAERAFDAGAAQAPGAAWSWRSPLLALALGSVGYGLWRAR